MALTTVQTGMNYEGAKSVHPFFSKPSKHAPPESQFAHDGPSAPNVKDELGIDESDGAAKEAKSGKKRARRTNAGNGKKDSTTSSKSQAPLEGFTRRTNRPLEVSTLEEDPNQDRRKRRKSESPSRFIQSEIGCPDWRQQLLVEAEKEATESGGLRTQQTLTKAATDAVDSTTGQHAPKMEDAASSIALVESEVPGHESALSEEVPKQATLKIDKNGKLLSSKPAPEPTASPKKRRGRPRTKPKVSPTITIIRYGSDPQSREDLGRKIDEILDGGARELRRPATPTEKVNKPTGPPKATHPFFTGKPTQKREDISAKTTSENSTAAPPRTPRRSAVTPGKLRAERRSAQSPQLVPAFGPIAADTRLMKHPGMNDAPWPTRDNAHVRNLEGTNTATALSASDHADLPRRTPKLKGKVVSVPWNADLINNLAAQLKEFTMSNHDHLLPSFDKPGNARLPQRLLTTGVQIQEQLRRQIRSPLVSKSGPDIHPALKALYNDIEHNLTPFDKGECEPQSWAQKYAPRCASHVLQSGREATALHDWLQNLTVKAVEGSKDQKAQNVTESKAPPKKKRKKAVDDFIVHSDEEDDDEEMVELTGDDVHTGSILGRSASTSLIRPTMSRHKNVILLSGPHGCGKSATVYAVAKELGFEVFEINSGSRRSAKDIQDRVGDMTENHLVSHDRNDVKVKEDALPADDTDNERITTAFQKDLDSGRQGTMTAFFTANARTKAEKKPKPKPKPVMKTSSAAQGTLPISQRPQKSQKQSLILFEEADVLFDDDVQFWPQVIKLASQSRRPIVITCNNESLIPGYALPLGAILRLSPPPADLAADYMLALAAREGHLIERTCVRALYESNNCDLRASITDLDFWCQMSIGDRKGGLEWIYQRWPPGKDVDEHGRTLRVASQGTFLPDMASASHDLTTSGLTTGFEKEQELLKQAWVDWGIRPDTWRSLESLHSGLHVTASNPQIEHLQRLDDISEGVSAADIYCRVGLPSYDQQYDEPIDPALPPLPEKSRLNYTVGAQLLQIDPQADFANLDTELFVQSHILRQRTFGDINSDVKDDALVTAQHVGASITEAIVHHKNEKKEEGTSLSRCDFSTAFDILASPPSTTLPISGTYHLTATSFDRNFRIVVEDLGPYIRSIVSHELRLETQRIRLGNLLSEGGKNKRPRTTRASRVALEGGTRDTKRRERWFDKDLNRSLVMATAGKAWSGLGSIADEGDASSRTAESLVSTQEE
ncbi:P-loop containing nucleoside triphosphate hydrolase protein [Lophiostoma macrostomum CBS 122681]|uniref:P-loop containing nucleoside triphosphate hydrolase protein n=1 Tax=Lophiostoma macrostomum CBS 122681 TaxID=1314788 RepID=A0A6A6TFZ2_9PLEO|nr:P-loop containing nucleoside triphosphate hydrolase protein [Lophiostoma macrostomum CBS 122681]